MVAVKMAAKNKIELLLLIGVLAMTPASTPSSAEAFAENAASGNSLFAQSAAKILQREFTGRDVSFSFWMFKPGRCSHLVGTMSTTRSRWVHW